LKEQTHQNSAKYTNMCPGLAKPVWSRQASFWVVSKKLF
jgi:hypothetical protein